MMKNLSALFGLAVLGVVLSLVMTIVTGVQERRRSVVPSSQFVPTPAIGQ